MLLQITEFPYFFMAEYYSVESIYHICWEDPLEEGIATHSSILAWRIPWTEEPGGLQSIGWKRVGHDWVTKRNTDQVSGFSKYCQFSKVAEQIHSPSSGNESSSLPHPPQFLELLTSLISIILMGHFYSIFFFLMNDDVDHFKF